MKQSRQFEPQYFRPATLAQFRWVAILGQMLAVFVAYFGFHLQFAMLSVLIVIGLWAVLNILQQTLFSHQLRMNEKNGFVALLIDLIEIAIVLGLTGGLNNPFVIFIAVPSILAATTLNRKALIVLIMATFAALILMNSYAQAVVLNEEMLSLPPILRFAEFVAIIVLILFLSFYARRASADNLRVTQALAASEMALQREHRLSSLGALVAAYAHELGTPLATIRMTSKELLHEDLSDEIKADIAIIAEQSDRSVAILDGMGKRGKADRFVENLAFAALIEEAAAPHMDRGKSVEFDIHDGGEIYVERSEAIIQGLRNLIQNAVDFAKSKVEISLSKSDNQLSLRIEDDGNGFPADALARAGEPYFRAVNSSKRPSYEGMGLGLFIAKTLLGRSGAHLQFANLPRPKHGGVVLISWPLNAIEIDKKQARRALGQNQVQAE